MIHTCDECGKEFKLIQEHTIDKQVIRDAIKKLSWMSVNNKAYLKINDLIKELKL